MGRTALYLHWHDHFELIYMTAGEATFYIDRQQYEVFPGDLLIVPSGALHVGYASTEEQIEYLALVFNRSLLESPFQDPVHERYLAPYLEGELRFPVDIHGFADQQRMKDILHSIIDEYERKAPAYELVVKSQVHLLFTLLARAYAPIHQEEIGIAVDRRMERIKDALLYIQSHYHEKLSLKEAARMVNLTTYHFCNVFKSATGRTFVEYVNRYRMDMAERLLREGATVTEAAGKVGYGNLNYFTRLYKQIKGITPSETKKREA